MSFGYGPGNEAQKSTRGNKALLGKRKSLQELRKENGSFSEGKLEFKKLSQQELIEFKIKVRKQKKKENILLVLTLIGCLLLGTLFYYLLTK
ncbi:hypothetical protein BXY85_2666 [Roseivirga pacifica]|uniref:Uncharacterized protein n=1 Tax=Roseivirga pacifica TaxID=1267423 RepID=A0A1I0P1P3_9BACT|nr:hypothetical protein [Roseivirga pacifica]RKQ51635.1 hypothetical protein BXY85_2666 [Roseivirga pacifica]SEW08044.1 hypothetical protein SAMN05216290_1647 [Roseivirga pacifica]